MIYADICSLMDKKGEWAVERSFFWPTSKMLNDTPRCYQEKSQLTYLNLIRA